METENNIAENSPQKLIRSEEFDHALTMGSDVKSEIHGTIRQKNKNNYDRFYEIMLTCNPKIQDICDKKKKDRTEDENETLKKFAKMTKTQYRLVSEMMFLSEDDRLNADGTTNDIPKKLLQLVEKIATVHAILEYIGYGILNRELAKRNVTVISTSLENRSESFDNEQIRENVKEIFEESCRIKSEVEGANREICENIFTNMVPSELQFDKEHNPSGIKDSDFKKMVDIKYNLVKSEKSDDAEAKEKANEKVFDEAEKRTFEIQRSMIVRSGLMALGAKETSETEELETE